MEGFYEELPRLMITSEGNRVDAKERYEKLGFKVVNEYDDLMYTVILPDDWELRFDPCRLTRRLYDGENQLRGEIFYNGVPWFRDAFMNIL